MKYFLTFEKSQHHDSMTYNMQTIALEENQPPARVRVRVVGLGAISSGAIVLEPRIEL